MQLAKWGVQAVLHIDTFNPQVFYSPIPRRFLMCFAFHVYISLDVVYVNNAYDHLCIFHCLHNEATITLLMLTIRTVFTV